MRAMILPEFGDPNLFEERDVERPEPGPGEVLVHIFASSVNLVDIKFRADGGSAGDAANNLAFSMTVVLAGISGGGRHLFLVIRIWDAFADVFAGRTVHTARREAQP